MTHTPEPWGSDPHPPFGQLIILGPDGVEIAVVNNSREIHEAAANLHLMMAAPRLLAALMDCVPWLMTMPLPATDQVLRDQAAKVLREAQAAIAETKS